MSLLAAEAGAHLCLFSSRKEPLTEASRLCAARGAASVRFDVIDLSNTEKAIKTAEKVLSETTAPDYLILNAGVSQRSMALDTELATTRKIIDLNFFGAVAMVQVALPAMVANGGGGIGYTSSLTGIFGFPLRSSYAASKHALHGYFESIALEYGRDNITVTAAVPGFIKTPISVNSLSGDGSRHGKMDANQEKGMDAGKCARQYWNAVIRGKWQKAIGGFETIMIFFYRYMPFMYRFLGKRISPV